MPAWRVCCSCQLYGAALAEAVGARAGMGFIQSNHSVIMYNNTMISFNMLEVSRLEGVKRCVRPA